MDRRTFILHSSGALVAVSAPSAVNAALSHKLYTQKVHSLLQDDPVGFSEQDWNTIAAVQNHLFPSEHPTDEQENSVSKAPGALEINALSYLHEYLSNPETDPSEVEFILSGVRLLQNFNNKSTFTELSIERREELLREFEKQPDGKRWLANILNYLLEALLTDPVYGGNPGGIGWIWLEHRAGEPRPPANKRYWLLS